MSSTFTVDVSSISNLADQNGFDIIEREQLPERKASYLPIPSDLEPSIRKYLNNTYPAGLYKHQVKAIEAILNRQDVCLSTSTASGKSFIFMVAALDLLLRNTSTKVLALYPAKALIQDQIEKWKSILANFGLGLNLPRRRVKSRNQPIILNSYRCWQLIHHA